MDPERLISNYLDDALTPAEVSELFQWIRSAPENAKQFASAAFMHRRLQHRLSAMRQLEEDARLGETEFHEPSVSDSMRPAGAPERNTQAAQARGVRSPQSRFSPTSWRFWSIAAAIVLIVGALAFVAWPRGSAAQLLAAENVTWGSGAASPKLGDRLSTGTLVLNSGLIKLGFDNGNQLLIEGPARFAITDARAVTLDAGTLTAIVTKAGRGLQVSTSTARVTDLGTEFGVQASATATRIVVFTGKVTVGGRGAGAPPQELSAGNAIEISPSAITPIPFEPAAFKRSMPFNGRTLDMVDLIAGGDGTGSASDVGINAATGSTRETLPVTIRRGDHRYHSITEIPVLDGCFIPGGSTPVDSAGHAFTFPSTSLFSYGLIWAGPNIPWEGELPIASQLPADAGSPTSRVLAIHSNNGITFNLDAIRALHRDVRIAGFRARVGNSYRPVGLGAGPARPLASIHVIVDGIARFERRGFVSVDPPIDVVCTLSDRDHFLTLATTDGGDGNACDWVLWTHPEFQVATPAP
jgi:hypothetical protein